METMCCKKIIFIMQRSFGQKEMPNQCFHSAHILSPELSLNIPKYSQIIMFYAAFVLPNTF